MPYAKGLLNMTSEISKSSSVQKCLDSMLILEDILFVSSSWHTKLPHILWFKINMGLTQLLSVPSELHSFWNLQMKIHFLGFSSLEKPLHSLALDHLQPQEHCISLAFLLCYPLTTASRKSLDLRISVVLFFSTCISTASNIIPQISKSRLQN